MKRDLPKHVYRKGTAIYWQRRGEPTVRMENQELTPAFWAEYALRLKGPVRAPSKRTFNGLIDSYRRSERFTSLAPRTRKDYERVLSVIEAKWGALDPVKAQRKHFIALRDANADAARFANYVVQVSRILMEHAIDIGMVSENPAKGIKQVKGETIDRRPWPADLVKAYRDAAEGRALLVFELCLGTGQRIGDVLKMRWGDLENGGINVRQNKTGKTLWVPLTKTLRVTLEAADRRSVFILTNERATGPWSYRGAAQAVRKVREKIGAEAYDIHALRYTAASELCSLGLTDEEIASVTGQSMAMVAHYTAHVRQKVRALKAQERRL
ncbi:integrase [Rhodovulum sp. BSW8]|uniref:tyrosine-type recombinase/integrase n=1 Tax=Rhodovulum sp. BSW8 TaxID=2259645 RepID=UPI000DE46143|nr:tyrosine-type recombinase/integrase [Rhodovulum sp. BSW8]RBO52636.1 integrase [Rhodovulum sp. BSW8]